MVRETSIEAYNKIKSEGLLKGRQFDVYEALHLYGPSTGAELFYKMKRARNPSHSNVTTRLGELRNMGVVEEIRTRKCSITGMTVIEWGVTDRTPVRFKKSEKIKCKHCDGKGYHMSQQARLFDT